jgi:hypothetical protein
MRHAQFWQIIVVIGLIGSTPATWAQATAKKANGDRVLAIDVLLLPDAKMYERAVAANARLRENYPACYTLGSEQVPHISLVHRYVRENDLPAIEEAVSRALVRDNPLTWELTATGYDYAMWSGVAITSLAVQRTPRLDWLQKVVVEAVEPYAVKGGTAAAFSKSRELPKIEPEIIRYVENFVPNAIADKYKPHVTIGAAPEDVVKRLKAEPFKEFTFNPSGLAIYQLGGFGTAQKKLWEWTPKRSETN